MRGLFRLAIAILIGLLADQSGAQPRITSPKDEFGFNFGDDYQLATYKQLSAYWQ
jgi:hypothetical protein